MKLGEPMSQHTSWRAGGPADRFYIPADTADLARVLTEMEPTEFCLWLGLGSNVLVRDGGIRGTVIAVTGVLDEIAVLDTGVIKVGAGVTCNKFARYAANVGLAGVEFLAGIPGTIGGALAMNAGAYGGETWDYVERVETMDRHGVTRRRDRGEFMIGYRYVNLPVNEWFVSAEFHLMVDQNRTASARIRELLSRRNGSQPTGESSCGSVFRNPPGDYAGRLIDACGLKGARVGRARVSEIHANFIINEGGASAAEIEDLIQYVQDQVWEKTGIRLMPEVRIIGEAISRSRP
jgi:UDP-N-acetylmuramate dehydrogenase